VADFICFRRSTYATNMPQKQLFYKEFNTLDYILKNAKDVLLVPHVNPDLDAAGSTTALYHFIKDHYKKNLTIACYDPLPDSMSDIMHGVIFVHPEKIDLTTFDVIIGCDSVERGFDRIVQGVRKNCVTVSIDHHHDITLTADVRIIDGGYAATCEILYNFFMHCAPKALNKDIATALLAGIIGDTGAFQHANTSPEILSMSAHLIKNGASITKIISTLFANRKIETLNLWGKALERTKFYPESGLAVTAITQESMSGHYANSAEISNIASMLTTVPTVRAALVVYQAEKDVVKGSLRAEKHANIDVSAIAHTLGGGGHPLASGFSIPGRIEVSVDGGWHIV
jgi:bifunctional oligoribonuclease and PAP phosphatase NrnA